jgi:hypothetical protein
MTYPGTLPPHQRVQFSLRHGRKLTAPPTYKHGEWVSKCGWDDSLASNIKSEVISYKSLINPKEAQKASHTISIGNHTGRSAIND